MITNTGKNIIAKYLVGQTPVYASYMAIGCGAVPLSTSDNQENYSDQTSMEFEMFRVPITSRGYIKETDTATITNASYSTGTITYTATNNFVPGDRVTITGISPTTYNLADKIIATASSTEFTISYTGTFASYSSGGEATASRSKVALTAELPTEQRYQVSEIGIYSAKSNPSATNRDSRMIYSFTETENWEYHNSTGSGSVGNTITVPLYGSSNDGIIKPNDSLVNATYPAFRASTDNLIFNSDARIQKYEPCRFLNGIILLPGDMSFLEATGSNVDVKNRSTDYAINGTHIHLQDNTIDLTRQSSSDELRLAFSIINKTESEITSNIPSKVLILIEFSSDDTSTSSTYARFEINSDDIPGFSPTTNRYYITTKKLSELTKSANFTWGSVKVVKIFVSVFESGETVPSDKFYVCLDAFRLENVTTQNPLYGLVGYSAVRTTDSQPILKEKNTANSVEFRYGLDVI